MKIKLAQKVGLLCLLFFILFGSKSLAKDYECHYGPFKDDNGMFKTDLFPFSKVKINHFLKNVTFYPLKPNPSLKHDGVKLERVNFTKKNKSSYKTKKFKQRKLTNEENDIGFIFDGFPRTLAQADALGNLLDSIGQSLDYVIELFVDDEKLVQRIIGRFTCSSCGELYHKITKPPKHTGICDVCGSKDKFNFRQDDNEDSLKIRLLAYYRDTSPLIGYYHVLNKLRKIDGLGSVDEIQNTIRNIIK